MKPLKIDEFHRSWDSFMRVIPVRFNPLSILKLQQCLRRRILVYLFMWLVPIYAFGQFSVSYHQSNMPFVGIGYDMGNKIRPEFRLSVDYFLTDVPVEVVLLYKIETNDQYELYMGLGGRTQVFNGLVIPLGVSIYPFENKKFSFQIELAPILGDIDVLRGSGGIRYRFK